MHCLYFPSIPNVLFFIFICFFYFSNPEPEKRERERGQAFRHRLDSCARFRSTRRVFREGLFESGKVIFALHDTKWLSYVRIKYLTSAAFIYHMYTYFSIAISMICIFYILYAIWSLNIDMHSHSKWKHTFCFDCTWIELVVLKCYSNITQYFFLTYPIVFSSRIQSKCLCVHLWLALPREL